MPVIASQVGANDGPAHAGVGGLEQHFTSKVQGLWIVRRKDNRLGPLKAVFDIGGRPADGIHGPWIDRLHLTSAVIVARDFAAVRAGVHDLRIVGIGSDVAAFAAPDVVPIRTVDSAVCAGAGDAHGGVVLLRSVDVVRKPIVSGDVIKLRGRLVVNAGPALRAVGRDGGAAIVPVDEALWVCGIDPKAVVVAVRHTQHVEGFAAVVRTVYAGI